MPYLASNSRYDSMTYNRTGNSGLKLPIISLGWWYNFGGRDHIENGRAIARRAFDLGVTHFDLANNYGPPPGSAEEMFGQLYTQDFQPYRDELVISTKAGYDMWPGPYGEWGSRKYLLASLNASLKRMKLDYVDIFYSHRFDPETPLEETMGALASAVRQGKALYVGISSYNPDQTRRAAQHDRKAGKRRHDEAGEDRVGERLRAVGEPVEDDPAAKRATDECEQQHLRERALHDRLSPRVAQRVPHAAKADSDELNAHCDGAAG